MKCLLCGCDYDPDLYTCPTCVERSDSRSRLALMVGRIEDVLLSFFLGLMVILVLCQILFRYAFETGIPGGDSLVRHLVLWIAFFGAAIASRSGSHVKIDVLNRILPHTWHRWLSGITDLFSFSVCALLVYASCQFVQIEYQSEGLSAFMDVPVWAMEIIIPFGFAIIAYRFFRRAVSMLFFNKQFG